MTDAYEMAMECLICGAPSALTPCEACRNRTHNSPAVPPTPTSVVVGPETGIPLVIAPTIRVTPTSVEEARKRVAAWMDVDDGEHVLVLDELVAAVRAEERAAYEPMLKDATEHVARVDALLLDHIKRLRDHRTATLREVREMVEGMIPPGGNGEDAYALHDVLAGLAKMENP